MFWLSFIRQITGSSCMPNFISYLCRGFFFFFFTLHVCVPVCCDGSVSLDYLTSCYFSWVHRSWKKKGFASHSAALSKKGVLCRMLIKAPEGVCMRQRFRSHYALLLWASMCIVGVSSPGHCRSGPHTPHDILMEWIESSALRSVQDLLACLFNSPFPPEITLPFMFFY